MKTHKPIDYEKISLKIINEKNILFINELCAYLPISRPRFYQLALDKLDSIKDAIENNKMKTKKGLQAKWFKSDNAITQIALYKLICTNEERDRLVNTKVEHAGTVKHITDSNKDKLIEIAKNEGMTLEQLCQKEGLDPRLLN